MPLSSKNRGSGLWCTVRHEVFMNGIFPQDIQDETNYICMYIMKLSIFCNSLLDSETYYFRCFMLVELKWNWEQDFLN